MLRFFNTDDREPDERIDIDDDEAAKIEKKSRKIDGKLAKISRHQRKIHNLQKEIDELEEEGHEQINQIAKEHGQPTDGYDWRFSGSHEGDINKNQLVLHEDEDD